ncbi:MAG TPA: protein phosphatase 2C domain-containing protein [Streptosporangiaceae bacterium]|nr:protein phosphatase 2C domain-containing protein [Streptosporangiaceae bacterium]
MTATPAAGPADPPGRKPGWLVLTASERGASHVAVKTPNQDAVATERAGAEGVVAAVADGHGHSRHHRSARGSRLAVKIGCQVAQELADRLEGHNTLLSQRDSAATATATAGEISKLTEKFLVPAIVQRWREAVLADVKADPFTDAEQAHRHQGDDATIAYGSTLLLGMVLRDWLILAQIGDGDVIGVRADGRSVLPVPTDPQLDGLVTTSLCGLDPRSDFRVAVVDTVRRPLLAVMLATDGYGNAQVVEAWPAAFSEDLAWMLRDRDVHWLASQLPSWAARCASSDGSADDTTVALMISPTKAALPPGGRESSNSDSGSEETTIPAVPHADTVPAQIPDRHPDTQPMEPVTLRLLAHRTAPEPLIIERASTEPAGTEPAGTEPPTNELARPDLGLDDDGRTAQPRGEQGWSDEDSTEPPTTKWRPPGAGAR